MNIFDGIPPDDGSETIKAAIAAIRNRAQEKNLLSRQWSIAELEPDHHQDFVWLCKWAQRLDEGTVGHWLQSWGFQSWGWLQVKVARLSLPATIGCLLLILASEAARQMASEGSLWPAVRKIGFKRGTEQLLFGSAGQPTQDHKDALEKAARELNLRHVFGEEGTQEWFATVYLQFGFTYRGFKRRLPEWLAGYGQPQAIQRLNEGTMKSVTFQKLWDSLYQFRRNNITETRLRNIIAESPWVLPEWTDELISCSKKRLHLTERRIVDTAEVDTEEVVIPFLSEPKLRWVPPNPPEFVCSVSNLAKLDLSEDCYDIVIAGRRYVRLISQGDETYATFPSGEIVLPADTSELSANLVAGYDDVVQSLTLQLWNANEDITIFHLSSGQRLKNETERMLASREYALLVASDLTVTPEPTEWYTLPNSMKFYYLSKEWSPDTEIPEISWTPILKMTTPPPDWVDRVKLTNEMQVTLGKVLNIKITHPEPITVLFVRVNGTSVSFESISPTSTIAEPITLHPDMITFNSEKRCYQLSVRIGLRNDKEVVSIRRRVYFSVKGAAQLASEGWTLLTRETILTREQAKINQFKVFPPMLWDEQLIERKEWALMEGDIWIRRLWQRPRPIGNLSGFGAKLTVCKGPYNATGYALKLAQEVIDVGILAEATTDDTSRTLSLKLSTDIEPDENHKIVWWNYDGSIYQLTVQQCGKHGVGTSWECRFTSELYQPLAIAVAYNGVRLGTWWDENWAERLLEIVDCDPQQIAAMIRWLRLPILSSHFRRQVQEFAFANPGEVLSTWLSNTNPPLSMKWDEPDEGWLSAVRRIFHKWQPDKDTVKAVIAIFADEQEMTDLEESLVQTSRRLLRIDPILMGKVLDVWIREVYVPQFSKTAASKLIDTLCTCIAESTDYSDDILMNDLLNATATTMGVHPNFVKKGVLQHTIWRFQGEPCEYKFDELNLALAISIEPFRRLLALLILETIQRRI